MAEKTTDRLTAVLLQTNPVALPEYFEGNAQSMAGEEKPFAAYMRAQFKKRGVRQQDVFLAADISEGYGYKLIAEEKHTRQRDVILRLCLGTKFSLDETQRALMLYGMSPLYARTRRDAVLIVAINRGIFDIAQVNELLTAHQAERLCTCGKS